MSDYNPQEIEKKWQDYWEKEEFAKAEDFSEKPKFYLLVEFPYPSGDGLHTGHVRSYSALDAVARKKRMEGFNVLYPMGWDAFGLPAENYAIKTGEHPKKTVERNIANFKNQMRSLGLSFDWSREINTTDPEYYKWTQWIFLKMFEKGLAYQAEIPINWCPSCKIGLANEEVVSGNCERCGTVTEKKVQKQWMLKITKYADRLIDDLELVDYPARVKAQQINWIGKSFGAEIDFPVVGQAHYDAGKVENSEDTIKVFTTRADTLFGVTAVVVSPEYYLAEKLITKENRESAQKYIEESKKKSDFEREKLEKEKTGVFTGSYCINPVNSEKVPVWIGDYVIASYGGGAVMVVPAHDQRDFEFAQKYNLPIKIVICPNYPEPVCPILDRAFTKDAYLVGSGEFSGLSSHDAREKITNWLEEKKSGRKTIQYKLRDWVFSRQHYWGEPIPLIHCEKCGVVPVPESDLPVELPFVEKYQPTGTGESPLAQISEWVNVKCPKCAGPARRETDTMPNWAGSNWYYLAYLMRGISNFQFPNFSASSGKISRMDISNYKEAFEYWMPVDWYNGGMEHTTLHLLYSRFVYKFLFDIGMVPTHEPYKKRTSHGIVLAEDGRKMSKSFGNIINPNDIVVKYGADALRLYEMFMGPFDQTIAWSEQGLKGVRRFLDRTWKHISININEFRMVDSSYNKTALFLNKTIQKVTNDVNNCKFNTAISSLMELVNFLAKPLIDEKSQSQIAAEHTFLNREDLEKFLKILAPFAPHMAEELWEKLGRKNSVSLEKWPEYDPKLIKEETITLVIQINGKIRDQVDASADISESEAKELALDREKIKKWTEGKEIKKVIFIAGKLINIVI